MFADALGELLHGGGSVLFVDRAGLLGVLAEEHDEERAEVVGTGAADGLEVGAGFVAAGVRLDACHAIPARWLRGRLSATGQDARPTRSTRHSKPFEALLAPDSSIGASHRAGAAFSVP